MDPLTRQLQAFLVRMAYQPQAVSPQAEHHMEHLLHLLEADEEEMLLHYFGLFGHERMGLDDIARQSGEEPHQTMATIDRCLRRLAVTPEWQMMSQSGEAI